ncbi:tagaturonate epimerase family protein [Acholeplasma vituli]|uniref:Tagaturonate/fructuronate epimerase n=1 Tax=Paracholeplasma vituli TaxID=69473 RepID=A0ABT2PZI2_9MOLU|nr:tagaturonate epimerase family protein [Paracholeplasma vituli]MCU0105152.1 tagaturonate epimerase family protein [Paracholeplasma vituli]
MKENKAEVLKHLSKAKGILVDAIYPKSVHFIEDTWVFMQKGVKADELVAYGRLATEFTGEVHSFEGKKLVIAPLNFQNGQVLRRLFPFTKPVPVLHKQRSFGLGDRLGLATEGHARVFEVYDAYPIFAQQSIRELNLTHRTYEDVLDAASFGAFKVGFTRGFGADGDHLKKPEDIEYALSLGFTMITLDASDYIRNDINGMSDEKVNQEVSLEEALKARYLNQTVQIEDTKFTISEQELKRCVLVYGKAIDFAASIYKTYFIEKKANANFELSIDETATPTTPVQHYFVANELKLKGVKLDTLAPRFCGEFQKGIDYVGDIKQFEAELIIHAAIARHFGYKLSIHSGSDKFSIFSLIGKHTRGHFHVKTAGTNWLEAMRVVAMKAPKLYRDIHAFAIQMFPEATKFYHVTTDLNRIPNLSSLSDQQLPELFHNNDSRQLIHITYGFILNHKDEQGKFVFRDQLFQLWRDESDAYSDMLFNHIGKHLELLYKGFK